MSSRKSQSTVLSVKSRASAAPPALSAPTPAPTPAPAHEAQLLEAVPCPLLCPTPDCNEHLRAHPHPSAPVLFAACGHSHCGLCAAVVLREPLPKCPTCGAAVGPGQASPNTGLGLYGEAVDAAIHRSNSSRAAAPQQLHSPAASHMCFICADYEIDEPAAFTCNSGSCDSKTLCSDHGRLHASKTGHTPVPVERAGNLAQDFQFFPRRRDCALHALPLNRYCMLHSALVCTRCVAAHHLTCAATYVKPVQKAADHFTPALTSAATAFTESANDMLHGIPAIIAAKTRMHSYAQASVSHFSKRIDAVIAALQAHRSRITTAVNLQCAEYTKELDSQAEVMSVSAGQLQAAAAFATSAIFSGSPVRILDAHATVQSMAALVKQCHENGPVVAPVVEVRCAFEVMQDMIEESSKVTSGRGLRVTSVSDLVLQPGPQQEFRVVLSLEDGSVPKWLTDSDVECIVQGGSCSEIPPSRCGTAGDVAVDTSTQAESPAVAAGASASVARVLSHCAFPGGSIVTTFELLRPEVQEVILQLWVCGVRLGPVGGWLVRCPQTSKLLTCKALGTHVRTLPVAAGIRSGMAVSADERWLVVGMLNSSAVYVYSLPGGELVRRFTGLWGGLSRLCFTPNGHLLIVDHEKCRLQEVTLEGAFVRFLGEGTWSAAVGSPWCVAVRDDVIAVGSINGTGPRVTLLGFNSGAVTSQFGEVGFAPGVLPVRASDCSGICFTANGGHVVVALQKVAKLAIFSIGGVLVKRITVRTLGMVSDVCMSAKGEIVLAGKEYHRLGVISADGSQYIRTWGSKSGLENGLFQRPTALAIAGFHLYVLDEGSRRVQLFQ